MDSDSTARASTPSTFVAQDTEVRLKIPPRLPNEATRREAMRASLEHGEWASLGHGERAGMQVVRSRLAPLSKTESCERRVVIPAPKRLHHPRLRSRVLVVDDEPLMRELVGYMLEPEFEVVMLEGGRAALAHLEGGAHFDVLLSDLMMPDISGVDLFRALVGERPALARRIIFMTGGTFTDGMGAFLRELGAEPLLKPFSRDEVLRRVGAQLGLP
jgi:CheY-like chemotaxis protein